MPVKRDNRKLPQPGDQLRVPLASIQELPGNPKLHANDVIDTSMEEWGYADDITINLRTGHLVGGHGRVEVLRALKEAGQAPPALIWEQDGDWQIPAFFVDVPEEEEGALSLALNRSGEVGGYDRARLHEKLREVVGSRLRGTGWTEEEKELLQQEIEEKFGSGNGGEPAEDPGPQIDKAGELREKWGTELGQVWEVGRHKIWCADMRGILPAWPEGSIDCHWFGGNDVPNIIRDIGKIIPSADQHPTLKPVELVEWFLPLHSLPGEIILDPFLGSGTTLVACDRMGRIGCGIELSPEFTALSLERLTGLGLTARQEGRKE